MALGAYIFNEVACFVQPERREKNAKPQVSCPIFAFLVTDWAQYGALSAAHTHKAPYWAQSVTSNYLLTHPDLLTYVPRPNLWFNIPTQSLISSELWPLCYPELCSWKSICELSQHLCSCSCQSYYFLQTAKPLTTWSQLAIYVYMSSILML